MFSLLPQALKLFVKYLYSTPSPNFEVMFSDFGNNFSTTSPNYKEAAYSWISAKYGIDNAQNILAFLETFDDKLKISLPIFHPSVIYKYSNIASGVLFIFDAYLFIRIT